MSRGEEEWLLTERGTDRPSREEKRASGSRRKKASFKEPQSTQA